MDEDLAVLLGRDVAEKVHGTRLLVVGAGGIGCELLKNLVLSGFRDIDLIDLDTIDLSNLNRQFLFQKQHIGQSKSQVARESALAFNPAVTIRAHHANIKEARYDVPWFRGFGLVLNALDNLDARRHVNLMCVAADVPLVESGTAGYDGQVSMHWKGRSKCFDCSSRAAPKTYPVCTIRSTPSTPIHCVVWAKNWLFVQLFGPVEEDDEEGMRTDANGGEEEAEDASEAENHRKEAAQLSLLRAEAGGDGAAYARKVFALVFDRDVRTLRAMESLWRTRTPPTPLVLDDLLRKEEQESGSKGQLRDHAVWSAGEAARQFVAACAALGGRLGASPAAGLHFDKDDEDAMQFVAAATALRSAVYGIAAQTPFATKSMAGNIIPAIATTNAIVAGMIVLLAYKFLRGRLADCRTSYVSFSVSAQHVFFPESVTEPSPECAVCSPTYVGVRADTRRATLQALVDLAARAGYGAELTVSEGERMLYDPDFDANARKTLHDAGCGGGRMVKVSGEADDLDEHGRALRPLVFIIQHVDGLTETQVDGEIELRRYKPAPRAAAASDQSTTDAEAAAAAESKKRKYADTNEISLLDDDDGAVEID